MNKQKRKEYHIKAHKRGGLDYETIGRIIHDSRIGRILRTSEVMDIPTYSPNIIETVLPIKIGQISKKWYQRLWEWIKNRF